MAGLIRMLIYILQYINGPSCNVDGCQQMPPLRDPDVPGAHGTQRSKIPIQPRLGKDTRGPSLVH